MSNHDIRVYEDYNVKDISLMYLYNLSWLTGEVICEIRKSQKSGKVR